MDHVTLPVSRLKLLFYLDNKVQFSVGLCTLKLSLSIKTEVRKRSNWQPVSQASSYELWESEKGYLVELHFVDDIA